MNVINSRRRDWESLGAVRIALFFDGFEQGGIGRINLILAEQFIARGYTVDLIVQRNDGPRAMNVPKGCNILTMHGVGAVGIVKFVFRYVRQYKPNAIIVSNLLPSALVCLGALFSRYNIKILAVNHGDMRVELASLHKLSRQRILLSYLLKAVIYKRVTIASVSAGAADSIAIVTGIPRSEIIVLHNPVTLTSEGFGDDDYALYQWWSTAEIKLLSLGRICPLKDYETMINAIGLLAEHSEVKLVIVGDGPDRGHLESVVDDVGLSKNIKLVGYRGNPSPFLQAADMLVSTSLTEALPVSIIEAMFFGTKIVVTDCPSGPREILLDGRLGQLVPVKNPSAFAAAVLQEHNTKRDAEVLYRRAQDFNVNKCVDRYLGVLFGKRLTL